MPRRGSGASRKPCAVPGCLACCVRGQLMCLRHWTAVPRTLRAQVYRTWRQFKSRDCRDVEQSRATLRAYSAAREAAIDAVIGAGKRAQR